MRMVINIDVPDLEGAIKFYCEALGLELNRRLDTDVAELTGGSATIYLLQKEVGTRIASGTAEDRHYDRHWTPVHIDFVVDDIQEAARRAVNAGAVRESELVEWRGSQCITFADPLAMASA